MTGTWALARDRLSGAWLFGAPLSGARCSVTGTWALACARLSGDPARAS
ncbi:hypothetical protein [Streptomyces sp. NPDC005012]